MAMKIFIFSKLYMNNFSNVFAIFDINIIFNILIFFSIINFWYGNRMA